MRSASKRLSLITTTKRTKRRLGRSTPRARQRTLRSWPCRRPLLRRFGHCWFVSGSTSATQNRDAKNRAEGSWPSRASKPSKSRSRLEPHSCPSALDLAASNPLTFIQSVSLDLLADRLAVEADQQRHHGHGS